MADERPMHDRDGFIWMDGKMVPWREANVHFLTHGLHYGTQVFEGERAYNGNIFKSREHSKRLLNSAKIIHVDTGNWTIDWLEDAKQEVMEANNLENCYMRAAIWRGSEQMGIGAKGLTTRIAIAAWDWGSYFDPAIRETGISLATSKWRKPSADTAPVHSKSGCLYNLSVMAKYEAQQAGYTDALMLDYEGLVAESTGANLFAIKDGVLHTPIADRFLNGITRQTVLELAQGLGIKTEERRIRPDELGSFEEIFLTGTAAELTPVGKIDSHAYKVGPMTKKLWKTYQDLVSTPPQQTAKAVNS